MVKKASLLDRGRTGAAKEMWPLYQSGWNRANAQSVNARCVSDCFILQADYVKDLESFRKSPVAKADAR